MQAPLQANSNELFGDAISVSQGSSSSKDKNKLSSIFSPFRPKQVKQICDSNKIIEVSDSDEDLRKAKHLTSIKRSAELGWTAAKISTNRL